MQLKEFLEIMERGETIANGSPAFEFLHRTYNEASKILADLNAGYHTPAQIRALFGALTGKAIDESFSLFPPFYTDFGKNIAVGKGVFINSGCHFQDQGGISIDDGALIGHNVVLATLNHDLSPRNRQDLHPAPIAIGKNAWIGANATILPGVTVGDGAIVAAGAVVTRNVEKNTIVGGVPANLLKRIE